MYLNLRAFLGVKTGSAIQCGAKVQPLYRAGREIQ